MYYKYTTRTCRVIQHIQGFEQLTLLFEGEEWRLNLIYVSDLIEQIFDQNIHFGLFQLCSLHAGGGRYAASTAKEKPVKVGLEEADDDEDAHIPKDIYRVFIWIISWLDYGMDVEQAWLWHGGSMIIVRIKALAWWQYDISTI